MRYAITVCVALIFAAHAGICYQYRHDMASAAPMLSLFITSGVCAWFGLNASRIWGWRK